MYSDSGDCPQTSAVFVTAYYYGSAEEFVQSCVDSVNFHLYLRLKKSHIILVVLFSFSQVGGDQVSKCFSTLCEAHMLMKILMTINVLCQLLCAVGS